MKIKGADDLIRKLAKLDDEVQSKAKKEIESMAVATEGLAVSRTPVDTGNLKASWSYDITGDFEATVYNSANYSLAVEFGTSNQRAQPMLFPAYEELRPKFISNLEDILKGLK